MKKLDKEKLGSLRNLEFRQLQYKMMMLQKSVEAQITDFENSIKRLDGRFSDKVDKLQRGDELMPGVEDG